MIGKEISHYKITKKLGEGGMGVVYKAEDTRLRRAVALKFPSREILENKENKARFLREAQAAAALDHSNICTTYEIDEAEGQPFIAMAFIEGESLEEKLRAGPLAPEEAVRIVAQVAEGLEEAHEKGIIHRDIKSANIMLTRKGQVKIMDFGLARLVDRSRLTQTATIMGTVAYMSPEQALGETVDHRTDIWSVGVLLHEMLTGELPFSAAHEAALIHKIVYEEPPPTDGVNRRVPPGLSYIVRRSLAKRKEDRYSSAKDLLADLRNHQNIDMRAVSFTAEPIGDVRQRETIARAEQRTRAKMRFYYHLAFFIGINSFLLLINILTSIHTLWFIWPFMVLGLPLFIHWLIVFPFSRNSSLRERVLNEEITREMSGKR